MSNALKTPDVSTEALMGEIVNEFLEQLGRGLRPEVEDYARRYPQLDTVLRQMLPALEVIHLSASDHLRATSCPAAEVEPESFLGDFRIVREVGRGGMGIVYEAEQISLGRRVALKVLPFAATLHPKQLQRFKNEAQAAGHLHHTNIVPIYAVGCERGVHYYVMQFIEGRTLAALILELRRLAGKEDRGSRIEDRGSRIEDRGSNRPDGANTIEDRGPTNESEPGGPRSSILDPPSSFFHTVAHWGLQAAEALEHAHAKGIIHRDIKPANLLVDVNGNLWITDFGLARMLSEAGLTMTGDLVGTLRYMSPEQALAKRMPVDQRTDIYSLGATLYELLTLRPAYDGCDRQEVMQQIAFEEPPPPRRLNRAIPIELDIIVRKALGKTPKERYATAQELADDLRRFLDDMPIRAKRPSSLDKARKWARRHQGVVATGIAGLVAAVVILSASTWLISAAYRNEAIAYQREAAQRQLAEHNLYQALLGQARALRQARRFGYREQVWKLLKEAMQLETPAKKLMDLRNEAVACMGDFVGLRPTVWDKFPDSIYSMALQPDGVQIALGLGDGSILVRDRTSGRDIARLPGHGSPVMSLSFAADGKRMASGDRDGKMQIWQASSEGTWACQRRLQIDPPPIRTSSLLEPPGLWVLSASTLSLLASSFGQGSLLAGSMLLPGGTQPRVAVALNPQGRYLAACSSDQAEISVWNSETDGPAAKLRGRGGESLRNIAFSSDGSLLAAGYERTGAYGILVWDVATLRLKPADIRSASAVPQVAFSPDGQLLAAGEARGVALYDTSSFQLRLYIRGDPTLDMAFSPDSQLVAIRTVSGSFITLWDVSRNREVVRFDVPSCWGPVAFSTDGKVLVTPDGYSVHIWNLAGAEEKLALSGHAGAIRGLAFSPDARLLASVGKDNAVRIWDGSTAKPHRSPLTGLHEPETVAFSPDGRMLAVGDYAGSIRIWDLVSWKEATVPAQTLGQIKEVAFSPNGKYFAACGSAGGGAGVLLWHLRVDGSVPENPVRLSAHPTSGLCFSLDSRLLAWAEEHRRGPSIWDQLRAWDLAKSRDHRIPLIGVPTANRHCLEFINGQDLVFTGNTLPDVWNIATGQNVSSYGFASLDAESAGSNQPSPWSSALIADCPWSGERAMAPRVWDLRSRKVLFTLPDERAQPSSFAWSPNRELLAVGLPGGELSIWNLPKIKAQLGELGLGW